MAVEIIVALVGVGGIAVGALGQFLTSLVTNKTARKETAEDAQHKLIDQLQEELHHYREMNDNRVHRLETRIDALREENRGYRAFIGVQRDWMAEHGIPLPPWPDNLPR